MRKRRWTVMVVPHGCEATRSWMVTERMLRALRSGAVAALLLLVGGGAAIGMRVGQVAPGLAMGGGASDADLAELRLKIATLQDTIESLGKRDEQLRLLAGIPSADSAVAFDTGAGTVAGTLADAPAPSRFPAPFRRAGLGSTDIDGLIRRANTLAASFAIITDTISRHVARLENTPSIMPTAGWLTSHFTRSRFHPILHISRPHEGIDVSAPMGAPIVAPAAGFVMRVARENGYGNVLEIDHGNGIVTKFAHCSRIMVREGQHVTRGQTVAAVGNTGLSTGPHLHYEIHVNGKVVDPLTYVMPGAIPD